jgi:lysophospholipase L1-like esterase
MKRNLAVAAVVLALCWIAAEWVVAKARLVEIPPSMSMGHPRRGYALRPGFDGVTKFGVPIHISSIGLRSPEIEAEKPAGTRRLVVLGDSVTFGQGVREEDTFSRRLEHMMRDDLACRVEVVNAGVSGYNSVQELDYFEHEGLPLQPDAVLVYQVENDYQRMSPHTSPLAIFGKDWIFYRSYVLNATFMAYLKLRWQMQAAKVGGDAAAYAAQQRAWGSLPGAPESLEALREIGTIARDRGIAAVLASHPNTLSDPSLDAERNRLLADAAAAGGMRFVDVGPALLGRDPASVAVSAEDKHPNALGHGLIAERLRSAVRDALACPPRSAGGER